MKVKNIFAGLALNSYWSLSFFLSNSFALRLFDMTKTIYKYNAFAPDARGDTFKESILAFYSPRRITPVNPWYRVKFLAGYYFTKLVFVQRA